MELRLGRSLRTPNAAAFVELSASFGTVLSEPESFAPLVLGRSVQAGALATSTASVCSLKRVLRRELMAALAVCDKATTRSALRILPVRHWLQVLWVHAVAHTAEMVQLLAGRNGADEVLVRNAVGNAKLVRRPSRIEREVAVAALGASSSPDPTAIVVGFNLRHEALQGIGIHAPSLTHPPDDQSVGVQAVEVWE